jgi:nucleoside 2-deoxyribosyltransferase
MKIYFACSITGGRQDEDSYQAIVAGLQAAGHEVLTAGLAGAEVILLEGIVDPVEVYERDTGWIRESNCLIAEVSTPSHGVGYEIGYALNLGKPVVCIYKAGKTVSKMILGNRDKALSVYPYTEIDQVLDYLRGWLDEIQDR